MEKLFKCSGEKKVKGKKKTMGILLFLYGQTHACVQVMFVFFNQ